MLILVINLGSTSTKVALYDGQTELDCETLEHSTRELAGITSEEESLAIRKEAVAAYLKRHGVEISRLSAIAARGGVIGQLNSGAYLIDEALVEACRKPLAPHVSNLTPIIAYELASQAGIRAYAYDMVCGCGVPEELYTLSGVPELPRPFLTHVLNSRAVCFEQAKREQKAMEDGTYIVTHMGGGITTNLIDRGKIKDIVADDEGAFSPERAGGVPCRKLVKLCFSGKYTEKEVQTLLKGRGGMTAYLGTNDFKEAERRILLGDERALLVSRAMAMQIAKDIGSLATVAQGKIDKIILTGGMAYSQMLTDLIRQRVSFIAPVSVIAGTFEMRALAWGVYRVLTGRERVNLLKSDSDELFGQTGC
jgi:butyrate kinase